MCCSKPFTAHAIKGQFLNATGVRSQRKPQGRHLCLGAGSCWSLDKAHTNCEEEKHLMSLYFQVDDSLERASQPHTKELKSVIGEMRAR